MSAPAIDTNVVLYLAGREPAKAARARELVKPGTVISVQVLNEAASVLTNKMRLSWDDTREFLNLLKDVVTVIPMNVQTHELGVEIAARHRLHVYDGLILASALLADCDTLYSEDMHAGLVVENRLRVINPFAAA
jgi:predicted nucleic acid-binding protein